MVSPASKTVKLNSGTDMPSVGFGTWKIRLNSSARHAVREALQAGYRLIDTARIYGNERGVGAAIRQSGVPREDIFVTTKLWNGDQGYNSAKAAFERSLERLGLDYVDLYLIHWPVSGKRHESWYALEEIYKSGRAKAIGVSNYTVKHLQELMNAGATVPAVNQVEFHPFLYEDQKDLLKFCKLHHIVVEAYSPLAHGKRMHESTVREIANKYNKTNAQIILRWCIQHGTVPLPKSGDPDHMKQNIDIFDFELKDEDMDAINGLSDGMRTCWDPNKID